MAETNNYGIPPAAELKQLPTISETDYQLGIIAAQLKRHNWAISVSIPLEEPLTSKARELLVQLGYEIITTGTPCPHTNEPINLMIAWSTAWCNTE